MMTPATILLSTVRSTVVSSAILTTKAPMGSTYQLGNQLSGIVMLKWSHQVGKLASMSSTTVVQAVLQGKVRLLTVQVATVA
jgi:hypothetical protein